MLVEAGKMSVQNYCFGRGASRPEVTSLAQDSNVSQDYAGRVYVKEHRQRLEYCADHERQTPVMPLHQLAGVQLASNSTRET